jgi:hypothetical protein
MKYVNKSYVEKSESIIELYDKTGNIISNDKKYMLTHYAKVVTNPGGSETCYIRTHQSGPLDPNGPYGKRERFIETKVKRASRNTFDFYMTYLKTNNSIYLTKAQRGFLND